MIELAAKIILLGSIFGLGFMIIRKTPVLVKLPVEDLEGQKKKKNFLELIKFLAEFWREDFQKKIIEAIKLLRKPAKKNFWKKEELNFSEDYWEKIRKG